jgi:hypothetical protein
MSCHASIDTPDLLIDTGGAAANVGTAAHEFYSRMVIERPDEPGDLFDLASKHGVDEDELSMLAWSGLREWKKIRDRIDVWSVEGEMAHVVTSVENKPIFRLTGHSDVIGRLRSDQTTDVIIDWKTGYKGNGYLPQTKGYATLHRLICGNIPERYLLLVVWTRLGVTETFEVSAADLMEFKDELCRIFAHDTKRYSPSDENCLYCPMALDCPARRALMEGAGRDIQAMAGEGVGTEITPAKLAALYPQSRVLKKALERYEKTLRDEVERSGPIDCGNGNEIAIRETLRTEINTSDVDGFRDIVRKFVPSDYVDAISFSLSKKALSDLIADHAEKRGKNAAIKQGMKKIEEAGHCNFTRVRALEYRKTEREDAENVK